MLQCAFNGVYCYSAAVQCEVSGILHFVQRLGYVEPCLAQQCCQAFHLYGYVLLALLCLATCCNELRYAPVQAGAVISPGAAVKLLCLAADNVEQVDGEDVVP